MSKDFPAQLVGTVGAAPDIKYLDGGTTVANFSVACRESKKENGEWVDAEATWIDCKAFGKLAENITDSLTKGTRVLIVGNMRQERWETDGGDKRSKMVLTVEHIGPELRWATAEVTKNPKDGESSGRRQQSTSSAPSNPYA